MDIIEKYYQEKESTIQYDISKLLRTDISECLKGQLCKFSNSDVTKFLNLFPIKKKTKIPEIRDSLNCIKGILPKNLFDDTKDEVKEICADYKWINSKDGEKILQIEEWIKKARNYFANDFPSKYIYIGRSFIEPISLIVGGYVKDIAERETIEKYFNRMLPPITIEYKINVYGNS